MSDYIEADAHIMGHTPPRNELGILEAPVRYEWVGGKVAYLSIFELPDEMGMRIAQGQVFNLGDLRLRVVGVLYGSNGIYVMRESPQAAAYVQWRRVVRLAYLCYRRGVITLAVWRLADYHEATIPSWRDIRAVQRAQRWYAKRGAK